MLFLFGHTIGSNAQVRSRLILIGDAGEQTAAQKAVVNQAAQLVLEGKTTVLYLGDNIYSRGMGLSGSEGESKDQEILRSQFVPLRNKGAAVYFIPGNHDWDKSGKLGLAKIKAQSAFLAAQKDSLLQLVPANGCPDPIEIPISDSVTVIAWDSEWWLFPYVKKNPEEECQCHDEKEILDRMEALLYKNRHKVVIMAAHHPFRSYGEHGGHFSWKDHLFPFTAKYKNAYIPLPIIGSIYPFLRTTVFLDPEDLNHPLYKKMVKQVANTTQDFPNVLFAAGHEHGLQLIQDKRTQIVSGGGAKKTRCKKGKLASFAEGTQGFVVLDELEGKQMQMTFYRYTEKGMEEAYRYTQPYKSMQALEKVEATSTKDSVVIRAHAQYNEVGKLHRTIFGENYRAEWGMDTKVPLIKISEIYGGLTPLQRGGGMQSYSLRLEDKQGREWVIRSVNKNAVSVLPEALRETFAYEVIDDFLSGQHPYSALMVAPIANAVHVPHANPVIGIIAEDTALGVFNRVFANTLCLLEEREPLGKSDNSRKMKENLIKDNDNDLKAKDFLRARILDLYLGDWDRHEDQWRWKNVGKGKEKDYLGVPRDRDQALHLTEGALPYIASRSWVLPTLQGFDGKINSTKYTLFKTRFVNAFPSSQLSHEEWTRIAQEFVQLVTDSVLEVALKQLPKSSYQHRHDELLKKLKDRRAKIPAAMEEYYRFINRIVDIQATDKRELVSITDAPNKALRIVMRKIDKDGEVKGKLMDKTYDPALTKEIRIYLQGGRDSVVIDNQTSSIKLRIIGGEGEKAYEVLASKKAVPLYETEGKKHVDGNYKRLHPHLSNDSANTAFVPVNLYNITMPWADAGYNVDDGFIFGLGFRHVHRTGFRKVPFNHSQQLTMAHSFSTKAYRIRYKGEWLHVFGKADLVINAKVLAPNNTQNFFGLGNNTEYNRSEYSTTYYRTRFGIYQIDPSLRWRFPRGSSLTAGVSFQYYRYEAEDNVGRFINNTSELHTYDSSTVAEDKLFPGMVVQYLKDARNHPLLPTSGGYLSFRTQAYYGANKYAMSFAQFIPEIAVYKRLDKNHNIVIANRIGGGVTLGKTTFYQSLFLGGHENLWGYKQYRFAGEQMIYNNFELRIKLAQIGSYILPGQLGIIGFYDIGKVWAEGYNSKDIHQGVGGGAYFAPAQMVLLQAIAGYSKEGWYPYVTMGFRF